MRRLVLLACSLLAALAGGTAEAAPPPASSGPRALESGSVFARLSTYGSWAAWSRYDQATHAYQLMVLDPTGSVRQLSVPESRSPFQVGLGPLPSGEVGAVLSRCGSSHRREPCGLYELDVQSPLPHEQLLAVPGGAGAASLPALWTNTIAFTRARPHRPGQLVVWRIGTHEVKPLKLPADTPGPGEAGCHHGSSCAEAVVGDVTALTLRGEQVAYVKTAYLGWNEDLRSELWVQTVGRRARKIDRIDQGEASGTRTFLSPSLTATHLYAYRHFVEFGNVWVRYDLRTHRTEQATIDLGDASEGRVSGADPLSQGVVWLLAPEESDVPQPLYQPLNKANDEQAAAVAGTEVLTLPTVSWAPGCDSRFMVEHHRCAPRRRKGA